jgi:catalase
MNGSELNQDSKPLPARLPSTAIFARLAGIGLLLAVIAGLFLYAGGWLTPHALTPAAMINTFERLNGVHSGFRRNHAKGVCVTGYFESNGAGQALSKAQVFRAGRVPIVGRFALAGGQPYAADTPQTVRSLAILFKQADGEEWRTAMINLPVFVVNNPQDFHEFLVVTSPNPQTGKVDSAAVGAFLGKHPETAAALKEIGSHPFSSGFGDSPYYALNAFRFVNANGERTSVRWWVKPEQGGPFDDSAATGGSAATDAAAATTDKNYLFDGLIAQIHSGPLRWHVIVTVGQPGDPTAQAASSWPADRQQIDVGTITIDAIESEDTSATRDINFDPLVLPDGISPSDDPLLSARSAAYSQSFTRREGEHKDPSAVSTAEVEKKP